MLIKKLNLSVTKKSLKLRDKIIRVTCLPTGRFVSIRVIRIKNTFNDSTI